MWGVCMSSSGMFSPPFPFLSSFQSPLSFEIRSYSLAQPSLELRLNSDSWRFSRLSLLSAAITSVSHYTLSFIIQRFESFLLGRDVAL